MPGIAAIGVYVPRLRLARATIAAAMGWLNPGAARARGERSTCNWDEDALTMAVEAGRAALADAAGTELGAVTLASTTLPFADRSNATLAAAALGLPAALRTQDAGGSQRAATTALAQAFAEAAAPGARAALVIGSDRRNARPGSEQELAYGHGAVACVIGPEAGLAEFVGATQLAADFVDHHRLGGQEFDYALEERWVREAGWLTLVPPAVAALLAQHGLEPGAIAHLVVPAPAAAAKRLARALGVAESALAPDYAAACGEIGVGQPLLGLAGVLESAAPGALVLVIGFGQGVDALLLRATPALAAARPSRPPSRALAFRREEPQYTRYLAHAGLLPVESGMRAERDARTAQTVAWRKRATVTAFMGGRCSACGTVQFPRSRVCVNPACRQADTQADHPLAAGGGRIKTYTEDWLAYSPRPPLVYGNVEFADGGNAFIEFADFEPGEAAVGAAVRFVFRLKDVDRVRGFRRYFWKAAPAAAEA